MNNDVTLSGAVNYIMRGGEVPAMSAVEEVLFGSFLIHNKLLSYSQSLQDLWVLYELDVKLNGLFLDFGAGDGMNSSNTYIFQKYYGWSGALLEPNEDYRDSLSKNVTSKVDWEVGLAIGPETLETAKFVVSGDPALSTLSHYADGDTRRLNFSNEVRDIRVESLAMMLSHWDRFKMNDYEIDYLSIDTEGSEYDILRNFFELDHGKSCFKLITVEHNFNPTARQKIFDLLSKKGYIRRFTNYSNQDDWYIREDCLRKMR